AGEEPIGFMSKAIPLPHMNAAIFSNGPLALTLRTHQALAGWPIFGGIEGLVAALPARLNELWSYYEAEVWPRHYAAGQPLKADVDFFAAGWSEQRERFLAYYMGRAVDFDPRPLADGLYHAPIVDKAQPVPGPLTSTAPIVDLFTRMRAADDA